MEKVLILGINGFTGRHFQDYIRKNSLLMNFSFLGVDKTIHSLIDIDYAELDLLDYQKTQDFIAGRKPDYIINLVGTLAADNFETMRIINAEISRNVFQIILNNNIFVKNILLIGSAAEYGVSDVLPIREDVPLRPVTHYGLSKAIQTLYANFYSSNFNINVNVARTFNLIGKGMSSLLSLGSFITQIQNVKNGGRIHVGNLETKRDFLAIEDAISAYWKILIYGKRGEIYNVCSGRSYCLRALLGFLIEKSQKKLNVEVKRERIKEKDVADIFGDNAKLKKDTHWREENNIFAVLEEALANGGRP